MVTLVLPADWHLMKEQLYAKRIKFIAFSVLLVLSWRLLWKQYMMTIIMILRITISNSSSLITPVHSNGQITTSCCQLESSSRIWNWCVGMDIVLLTSVLIFLGMENKGKIPKGKNMSSHFLFALAHSLNNIFSWIFMTSSLGQGRGVMQWHSTDICEQIHETGGFSSVQWGISNKKAFK